MSAHPRRQVVIFALLTAACVASDAMLYVILPVRWMEAGLSSLWEVGVLLSLNRLARLPLNPVIGFAYSRLSVKTCAVFAALLSLLIPLGYVHASTFAAWAALRVLWGLAWSLLKLGGLFTVMDVAGEHDRGYLIGLYTGTYRLGNLVGMLGGGLMADMAGLRPTLLAGAAVAALALPMALFLLRRIPPEKRRSAPGAEKAGEKGGLHLLTRELFWVLLTCLFVTLIIEGFFMSTLSALLEHHFGAGVTLCGFLLGCATLAGFMQSLRWGWDPALSPLAGRISDGPLGRTRMFAAGCFAAALLFFLTTLKLPLLPWLLLIVGIELCCTAMTTLSDALATDVASRSQPVFVITAYTLAIDLGAALGPLGGFAVIARWGMDAAYLAAALLLLLFALRWAFRPPVREHPAP
ncbi:MFS transporter [Mailhella massiliensis]|uniref:MFS transporter n=1 Tax=Mailhella massiliensis TaxID=1903261 RepID=A0A921AVQ1_9BACT|nr:MFS transporter [Mailhella massiliensis]HJD96941.1 MFS transporter [Mailhella massiliensis]